MRCLSLLIRWFILLISLSVLTACGITQGLRSSQVYRVRSGDTLYAIAWRYQVDYKTLAQWNGIRSPYIIHPDQELILVDPEFLPENRRPKNNSSTAATASVATKPRTVKSNRKAGPPPGEFRWPTEGKVVRHFKGSKSSSQGIDIAGQHGQPIYASADGRVVYSGSGLAGYGKLVIVKHSEDYLSAYAHNSRLNVKEGEQVKAGQVIANMGAAEQDEPRLHFEVRKQGQPVDPLKYLPER
ncbi:MAG: peptidoglycan DD-metalloendopeptidase family protein [Gammaproteobacteria bacterium]|nr:peptidoglycan DD-metalloendopeptidase family protein [Gammaproteobacteria bacterium]